MRITAGFARCLVVLLCGIAAGAEATASDGGFNVYQLVKPSGALALLLFFATAATGVFLKRHRRRLLPWHLGLAIAGLVVALVHVGVVATIAW